MGRIALIKDGVVHNVMVTGPKFECPRGFEAIEDDVASIGDKFDGKKFERKPSSMPSFMTMKDILNLECQRRILAVASLHDQSNMTHAVLLDDALKPTLKTWREWVESMRQVCMSLAKDEDINFRNDSKWPAAPKAVVDLIAKL